MPTGYTAELMEKGMDFRSFVLRCARAFGALLMMRDDPLNAPIPEKFEPSDYHVKALAEATKKHILLQAMTDNEKIAFGEVEKADTIKRTREWLEKEKQENMRLIDMRLQVQSWNPPTPDHVGLKDFMLQQIDISMHNTTYQENEISNAEAKPPTAFYVEALSRAAHDIEYHAKENIKEIGRATERTDWVKKLRASI